MTVDEPGSPHGTAPDEPGAGVGTVPGGDGRAGSVATRSDTALAAYRARMRRARLVYAGSVGLVVVAALVVAVVVYSRGEIAHATLRTVAAAPPTVAAEAPSATPQQAWRTDDATATGDPVWGGTVVTHDAHTVRGRDARTGAQTWSYTRTDRVVCDAVQTAGTTIAVFLHKGNCDEVTALDSGTGARRWTRTLDENGQPLDGRPAIDVNQYTILLTTPQVIYAIDPGSGIDRWVYGQQGCHIASAVLGSTGVLISQNCSQPDCTGRKFCGTGPQLLLRDGNAARTDDDKANPDHIIWNLVGNGDVPASADTVVTALRPGGTGLDVLDNAKGRVLSTLALRPAPGTPAPVTHLATARAELVHVGDTLYSVQQSGADLFWGVHTLAMPSVTAPDGTRTGQPDLVTATVAVPSARGIDLLDGGTGRVTRTFLVGAQAPGSSAYPLGSGFLVAGPETVVYR